MRVVCLPKLSGDLRIGDLKGRIQPVMICTFPLCFGLELGFRPHMGLFGSVGGPLDLRHLLLHGADLLLGLRRPVLEVKADFCVGITGLLEFGMGSFEVGAKSVVVRALFGPLGLELRLGPDMCVWVCGWVGGWVDG